MRPTGRLLRAGARLGVAFVLAVVAAGAAGGTAGREVVHVYNWNDYIAPEILERFTAETGIEVIYDLFDSNEMLEAKLLAGGSGYDVVVPTARPYAARQIAAGVYQPLDRARLPNHANLDPRILASLADIDPGNAHVVPYMWGTTGIGYNVARVKERLGGQDVATWRLLFDPALVGRLADCGVTVVDDAEDGLQAMLIHLGLDPAASGTAELERVTTAYAAVRPHIRYFHSSQYINDLANGDTCVAMGYSGDILQARDRAAEAGNGVEVRYVVPAEGAMMWVDLLAVPKDAPHAANAHRFIDFLLRPEVIALASNFTTYANANAKATPLLDAAIRDDPGVYPNDATMARLRTAATQTPAGQRSRNRAWARVRSGR
jgi:putrescine transport system substrate-binding protein